MRWGQIYSCNTFDKYWSDYAETYKERKMSLKTEHGSWRSSEHEI